MDLFFTPVLRSAPSWAVRLYMVVVGTMMMKMKMIKDIEWWMLRKKCLLFNYDLDAIDVLYI